MQDRIRTLRKTLKISQNEFGKKLGVSNTAISKLENGENSITEQMIKSICREFNVNYLWLTEGEGEMFSDFPETILDELKSEYKLDDLDMRIIRAYLSLDEAERDIFKKYFCVYYITVPSKMQLSICGKNG